MTRHFIAAACAATLAAPLAFGSGGDRSSFEAKLKASKLVFEGQVTKVEFQNAEPAPGGQFGMPHTFVTYRIDRVHKGRPPAGGTITLRFRGGWNAQNGQIVKISNSPTFDPGDRDLLLVAGNLRRPCPLVGCAHGRLRLLGGKVMDDDGHEMGLDALGKLAKGRRQANEEVDTFRVPNHVIRRVRSADAGEGPPPTTRAAALRPLPEAQLAPMVAQLVYKLHTQGELGGVAPEPTAQRGQAFREAASRAVAPKIRAARHAARAPATEQERREWLELAELARTRRDQVRPSQPVPAPAPAPTPSPVHP